MTVSEGLLRRFNVKSVRFVRKVIKLGLIVRAAVNPLSANPQNGQTDSNNSSAICRRIV